MTGGASSRRVQADESLFVIADASGGDLDCVPPTDDDLLLIQDGWAIVRTGAQWGPVEVTATALAASPALGAEWDEVLEFSVHCTGGLIVNELLGNSRLTVTGHSGDLRVRVSARGRAAGAKRWQSGPRSTILEFYLIEAWPAPPARAVTLRKVEPEPVKEPAVVQHEVAGQLAAQRLDIALTASAGPRGSNGRTGTVQAEYEYSATRRKLFAQFADLSLWLGDGGSGDRELGVGKGYSCRRSVLGGAEGGEIRCTYLDFDSPRFVIVTWNWFVPPTSGSTYIPDLVPFLDAPAMLRFDLVQRKAEDGTTRTTVALQHSGLPVEWLEDMTHFWEWKLEQGEKHYDLGHY